MTACSAAGNETMIQPLIQYCPLLVKLPNAFSHLAYGLMAQLAAGNSLHCMELLLEAGYQCSRAETNLCQAIQPSNTALVRFVREQILQPSPLLRLCRVSIRMCLQTHLHKNVLELPLPEKLRKQILLEDVCAN